MHNARLANYSQAGFYFKIVECKIPRNLVRGILHLVLRMVLT